MEHSLYPFKINNSTKYIYGVSDMKKTGPKSPDDTYKEILFHMENEKLSLETHTHQELHVLNVKTQDGTLKAEIHIPNTDTVVMDTLLETLTYTRVKLKEPPVSETIETLWQSDKLIIDQLFHALSYVDPSVLETNTEAIHRLLDMAINAKKHFISICKTYLASVSEFTNTLSRSVDFIEFLREQAPITGSCCALSLETWRRNLGRFLKIHYKTQSQTFEKAMRRIINYNKNKNNKDRRIVYDNLPYLNENIDLGNKIFHLLAATYDPSYHQNICCSFCIRDKIESILASLE